ncbi:MAG: hypothetical protein LBD06_06805 [Candidatus Accumulibacter sp.]|nr:hypothetical protein [Accumulibacter sp.]
MLSFKPQIRGQRLEKTADRKPSAQFICLLPSILCPLFPDFHLLSSVIRESEDRGWRRQSTENPALGLSVFFPLSSVLYLLSSVLCGPEPPSPSQGEGETTGSFPGKSNRFGPYRSVAFLSPERCMASEDRGWRRQSTENPALGLSVLCPLRT